MTESPFGPSAREVIAHAIESSGGPAKGRAAMIIAALEALDMHIVFEHRDNGYKVAGKCRNCKQNLTWHHPDRRIGTLRLLHCGDLSDSCSTSYPKAELA